MEILLSIKPKFSNKILSGEKKYEFRKRKPKQTSNKVYIYESNPTKQIVGWFIYNRILTGSPIEIWEKCRHLGGIERESFFQYCNGNHIIHAFEIKTSFRFELPINPYQLIHGFSPPQDFQYFNDTILQDKINSLEESMSCPLFG